MSNGLGAGFFGLTLLAILLGLAAVLTLALVGVVEFRRRIGTVPQLLKYVSIAVLGGVLVVAGFGVLAMYDEAVLLAVLFLVIVFVPLTVVGIYLHQTIELTRVDVLVTAGLAWSLPFVIGVGVTFGLTIGVSSTFDLAPAESQRLGVVWIAMFVGGAVIVIGSVLLGKYLSQSFPSSRSV
ncbi:hypothetical protein [Natronomonas gomsonensis]|uniref:hypothetical protein n=1 Tax=Natronomonas gomsonensis TaxID=1046043 RepID=UPI0020CA3974|nr:hypothetical protein [Natronomonas gomsonensis]